MGIIGEITSELLKRRGWTKEPSANISYSGTSFDGIQPDMKADDFVKSYKGWVYANVKRRAEQMANVDIKLMRQMAEGSQEVTSHRAIDLIRRVNNFMTMRDLLEITYSHLDLAGEAFWAVDRGRSGRQEPQAIVPLLPQKVTVVPGENQVIEGYIYKRKAKDGTEERIRLSADEVVFFKEPDPNDLVRGMSAVKAAALSVDTDEAQEKWNWKFFEQGATSKPVFETDQRLDDETLRKFYREIDQHWSGLDNAHKAMILHSGLKAGDHTITPKDMEWLEGQRWTRDKIMAILGTTKTILGITEDVNRSNAETNEFVFAKYMVQPRVQKVISNLNEWYLPMFRGTGRMFFMHEDPVPTNVEQETQMFRRALAGGSWMTPNEVRERKGLEPIANGDSIFAPNNLVSIGSVQQEGEERAVNEHQRKAINSVEAEENRKKDIQENVSQITNRIAEDLVRSKQKQREMTYRERAEQQGGFHDQFKQFNETAYQKIKDAMQQYFNKQKQIVENNLRTNFGKSSTWTVKAPADKFLFEKGELKTLGISLMTPILEELFEERGEAALEFLGSTVAFNINADPVRKYIESNAGRLIDDIDTTTQERLRKTLGEGLDQGEGIADLSSRVENVYDVADDARAENIARTESLKASNAAQEEAWKQSGVVKAKEWLTAADERVDPLCRSMDGEIIPLGEDYFKEGETLVEDDRSFTFRENTHHPPLHPQCRCTLVPVTGKSVKYVKRQPENPIDKKRIDKLNERLKKLQYYGSE